MQIEGLSVEEQEKIQSRATKLETELAKLNEQLTTARNNVMKKDNAYHRKVETESLRQGIEDQKKAIKAEEKHQKNREADVLAITTE